MSGNNIYYRYSVAFKQKVINEIESGKYSLRQAGQIYNISYQSLYNWLREFGKNDLIGKTVKVVMKNEADKIKLLEEEKKKLESALAQAYLKIVALESTIEIAEEKYHIDVKKKSGFPVSNGSGKK